MTELNRKIDNLARDLAVLTETVEELVLDKKIKEAVEEQGRIKSKSDQEGKTVTGYLWETLKITLKLLTVSLLLNLGVNLDKIKAWLPTIFKS